MEKINFNVSPSVSQKKETEDLIQKLKQDTYLLKLLDMHDVDVSCIDTSPWLVQRWYTSLSPCLHCQGLYQCGQKMQGYYEELVDDGYLHTDLKACRYMRKKREEEKHLSNFYINDLPEDMHTVSFSKISLDDVSEDYSKAVTNAMKACTEDKGLYIHGPMGTGKTYLAACAANWYGERGRKTAFLHYPSFCMRMAAGVRTGEFSLELKKAMSAYFCVIDDIGAESVTEWNRDQILLPLLNERYEKHLPTWFTSNEDMNSLEDHYRFTNKGKEEVIKAARIMERIKVMAKPQPLTGEDRRIKSSNIFN